MAKRRVPLYCATDKEIFDALASSAQHFTVSTLLGLAKKRGIFFSPLADRMQLCNDISLLIFGFNHVAEVQGEFEKATRSEKRTFKHLRTGLNLAEFRSIAAQYVETAEEEGDSASYSNDSATEFRVNVKYDEVDFSKTRLRQRQRRDASIQFEVRDGETIISYPSNEKIRLVVEGLIDSAKTAKKEQIAVDEVDLSWIKNFDLRTKFFQELIKNVPGFKLEDVTHVQVDFGSAAPDDPDLIEDAEDEKKAVEEEITSVVKDVALHGKALHVSPEYKRLREKGFFLTSIQWSGRRTTSPYEIVQFDAGFDDPAAGVGYKYGVRTWKLRLENGQYAKSWVTIPAEDKSRLSRLLQKASMEIYLRIKKEYQENAAKGEPL